MLEFFPMARGDRFYLLAVVIGTIFAFLPWWRDLDVAGMSLFGWIMALLMIVYPAGALFHFLFENRKVPQDVLPKTNDADNTDEEGESP